jgi:tRNA-dependent cyclodipeptide synthase
MQVPGAPYGQEAASKHVSIVGISMLNSYFTEANIAHAAADVRDRSRETVFMLPDLPAESTLMGYGYLPDEARKTAQRKFKALEKTCRTVLESVLSGQGRVVRWGDFQVTPEYGEMLDRVNALYDADPAFREDVRSTTGAVYEHSKFPMKRPLTPAEQIDAGKTFLLQELAFIMGSPQILGVETAEYVYHRDMPILDSLCKGAYLSYPAVPAVSFRKVSSSEAVS